MSNGKVSQFGGSSTRKGMGVTSVRLTHGEEQQAKSPVMESRRIVSQHTAVFNTPPGKTPSSVSVDGPLLGNGEMEVAIGGPPEAQFFFLCKNDLWRLQHADGKSSPVPFGQLAIDIPALKHGTQWRAPPLPCVAEKQGSTFWRPPRVGRISRIQRMEGRDRSVCTV